MEELPSGERENTVKVYEEMFVLWQTYKADGATYASLKCRFDMFSVFAGRNPLVSVSFVIGMWGIVCYKCVCHI